MEAPALVPHKDTDLKTIYGPKCLYENSTSWLSHDTLRVQSQEQLALKWVRKAIAFIRWVRSQ